ncbi:MAG TPA: D-alanine--D-alanine ligase [Saprospiraceae bacterium]|nr:D-alanine--D-alanine ligase [Saprospiraceae bacterium]
MDKIRVGIFFGGPSREREISFAGGRTVFDNLNKSLFEPVLIFVDTHRHLILLDWQYVYKGTIRDFYPPVSELPDSPNGFQVYAESLAEKSESEWKSLIEKVGKKINWADLSGIMDVAFLALHGNFGEDGQIQGLLESIKIPYTGSGIRACAIGMDKAFQKKIMEAGGFACPEVMVLDRADRLSTPPEKLMENAAKKLGWPMVIRPANQGSSIGVSILSEKTTAADFEKAVNRAFFCEKITAETWNALSENQRIQYVRELTDIRDGLGFPVEMEGRLIYHPEELLSRLNTRFQHTNDSVTLESQLSEQRVILEAFIKGKEFSCIVIRDEKGKPVALPPTEIVKGSEVFDYRSKYLPGLSRKITPIELPGGDIQKIRSECERLFDYLEFNTYARIDGFFGIGGEIFLNDPNTTSGMLPSSFFFHQAAEIGLNPSQFLTYIIRTSVWERLHTSTEINPAHRLLLNRLDKAVTTLQNTAPERKKVAVIMGGYSFERHISVESGRNIFEKVSSSATYEPLPVFLAGSPGSSNHTLFQIPVNLLLKDNADDIRDKILNFKKHPLTEFIKKECADLTAKYASKDVVFEPKQLSYEQLAETVDAVFIALHGRPGEDGEVQSKLDQIGLPYNGSSVASSRITINKFETLRILREHGFPTANQMLVLKDDFKESSSEVLKKIESAFDFPLVAKPVDDGCSSAVKVIKNQAQLEAFLKLMFRNEGEDESLYRTLLNLRHNEEFPAKPVALIESLITAGGAKKFLEITGGMLTHHAADGGIYYEVFEPSEALASGEVLSLEEKFLAGEGQNITPARFADKAADYEQIVSQVKKDLERAARILGVTGYCRIDAFVRIFENNRAETIIIEVNSLPGMTPATCIYHQAAINGYKPFDFIDKILEFGIHEQPIRTIMG